MKKYNVVAKVPMVVWAPDKESARTLGARAATVEPCETEWPPLGKVSVVATGKVEVTVQRETEPE